MSVENVRVSEGHGEMNGMGVVIYKGFFGGRVGEDVEVVEIVHFLVGVVWCGVIDRLIW